MRKHKDIGFILTKRKACEIFYILSVARLKLNGKVKTSAQKYWEELQDSLDLNPNKSKEVNNGKEF